MRSSPQVTFSLTIPSDELPNLFRERWAAASRLPTPVQLETFAMPTNENTRLDDHERCLPIEQARPKQQAQPGGVGMVGFDGLGSRPAVFAGTRSRRPKPPASVKSSSRTEGRPGAIPTWWRNRSKDYAKESDGTRTCPFSFAQTLQKLNTT
jgi:hypothetical protein